MKKNKQYVFALVVIIIILGIALFRTKLQKDNLANYSQVQGSGFLMNTVVQIRICGDNTEGLIDKCFGRLQDIENKMSKTIEDSDVYRVNENQGEFVFVSSDTFYVLKKALDYAKMTEGKFDPSIGPLVDLWGIDTENARVPSIEELTLAKAKVNYKWVDLEQEKCSVRLKKEGMKLDLGAIVKGYAADELRKILEAEGIKSAYINLGGNVLVMGGKPDNTFWKIGIMDPRRNKNGVVVSFEVNDKTIVTSGNYERYFEEDGVFYHHIIDPATGYPAESSIISVSIITDNSIDADALSTCVFVLGLEKGLQLVDGLDGVEAILIKDDLGIIMTDGLKDKLILLNNDFYFSARK